jgi:hypothetical protein
MTLRPSFTERRTYHCEALGDSTGPGTGDIIEPTNEKPANLVSSLCENGLHYPAIDLDFPAELIPSSTPGHFHLYLDAPMSWEQYIVLLAALADAGVISRNYYELSLRDKQTLLRLPHVKKNPA